MRGRKNWRRLSAQRNKVPLELLPLQHSALVTNTYNEVDIYFLHWEERWMERMLGHSAVEVLYKVVSVHTNSHLGHE